MRKKLHRYILWRYLAALFSFFVVFVGLFILIELFELQDYLKPESGVANVAMRYFFYRLPFLAYLTVPVAVLMAAVFIMASLAHLSETIAAQAAGVSVKLLLRPILVVSVAIALLLVVGSEFFVPEWSDKADYLKRVELQKRSPPRREYRDIAFRTGNRYVLVDHFSPVDSSLTYVTIIQPNDDHTAIGSVDYISKVEFGSGGRWSSAAAKELPPPRVIELIATYAGYSPLTEKEAEAISLSDLFREYAVLRSLRTGGEARDRIETEMSTRMTKFSMKLVFPFAIPPLAFLGAGVGMMLGRRRGILFAVSGALVCTLSYMLVLQACVKLSDMAAHTEWLRVIAGLIPLLAPASVSYAAFLVLRRR